MKYQMRHVLVFTLVMFLVTGACPLGILAADVNAEGTTEPQVTVHEPTVTSEAPVTTVEKPTTVPEAPTLTVEEPAATADESTLSTQSSNIAINSSTFPDEAFRNWVITNIAGGGMTLTPSMISNTTKIEVVKKEISDLTGIQYFTNLTDLSCDINNLDHLDVSKNTKLLKLTCYNNHLTQLDVSHNAALTDLSCGHNQLTSLDVSRNTELTSLECGTFKKDAGNNLTALDVTHNKKLTSLRCDQNQLKELDVSQNSELTELWVSTNQLRTIDVSKNLKLKVFTCINNQLEKLDVKNNVALENLECAQNFLTDLDLSKNTAITTLLCDKNQLTSLDLSKNTAITYYAGNDQTYSALPVTGTSGNWQIALSGINNSKVDYSRVTLTSTGATLNKATGIVTVTTADQPTTLTYTYATNNGSNTMGVTVNLVNGTVSTVTLDQTSLALTQGNSITLKATVKPDTAINKAVTWTSSNNRIATVDSNGKVTAIAAGTAVIRVTTKEGGYQASCNVTVSEPSPIVRYSAHGQNYGWDQGYKQNGETAGTTGQGLRIEAFKAKITDSSGNAISGLGISYDAHCADIGWQTNWASDDGIAGTTGQARQVEAIRMKLTGSKASQYDIYYRVHAENFGWMNWAKNGEDATFAGTNGYGFRIEAIQIEVVKKGAAAPTCEPENNSNRSESVAENVTFAVHGQNYGWSLGDQISNQMTIGTAGTTGLGLRVEAFKVKDSNANLNITYRAHVQNVGWQSWKSEGQIAGTTGQGLRVEAVELKAVGTDASRYDVYYRAHVENQGWSAWVKDGATAGTTGLGLRVEAMQIKVVEK